MMRSLNPFFRLLLCLLAAILLAGCSRQAATKRSLERARGFVEQGEYEKAKVEYLSIIQKNRRQAEAFSQLGRIWSLQGSTIQAYPYLRRAQELGRLPEDLRPQLLRALLGTGQLAEAQREAREILKGNPAEPEALMLLAETARTPEQVTAVWQEFEALPGRDSAAYHAATVPLLLRMNRLPDAQAAAARALEMDPKLGSAHLAQAMVCRVNNDQTGLEQAMSRAAELAPVRSPQRLVLAELKLQQGRPDEARAHAEEVLRQAPDYVPALFFLARLAMEAKAYDDVLSHLNKLFAIDTTHPQGRLLQAEVLKAKNDASGAVGVLERLNRMFEESVEVRMKLAQAHLQAGQLSEAADLLNGILIKNPDLTEASMLLAVVHMRQGNPAAVVPAMQAVLERDPGSETAAFNLVLALEAQRRFEEALVVMRQLAEKNPANPVFRIRLGQLLTEAGEFAEARTVLEQLAAATSNSEDFAPLLLEIDLREGRLDEALRRAGGWRERQPGSVPAWFAEARVHILQNQWEPAEAALRKVLELEPGHAPAMELLARVYASTNRLPEAVRATEERMQRTPDDAAALNLLALLRTEQKEYAKAAEAYEKIRASLPEPHPPTLNNLAVLYAEHLGKIDQAYELAGQARALRPSAAAATNDTVRQEAAAIADTLGRILYLKGRFQEAMRLADEAMTFLSSSPEVQAHFGLTAAAMGRTEEAKAALARALEGDGEFVTKAEARQRLALLSGESTTPQTSSELAALAGQMPKDPLLRTRLAEALEKENKFTEAAAAYETALTLNPELAPAALKLAELHDGPLNDPAKALAFARKARDLAPSDPVVAGVLGGLAYRSGEHQWSYDLLTEAARAAHRPARVLLDLGRAAYSLGRLTEARAAMENALQATPAPDPQATTEARTFLALTAVPAPAEALAQQTLAGDADNVPALMVLADARFRGGDTAAAVATWEKVLGLFPESALARKHLAIALVRDPAARSRAYDLAFKARETLPDDPELTEAFAVLVHHRNDHQYAVDLFLQAAAKRPLAASSLFCLGVSQLALGQTDAGRTSLTRAVAAGLKGTEAEQAAKLLQ